MKMYRTIYDDPQAILETNLQSKIFATYMAIVQLAVDGCFYFLESGWST